MYQLNIIVFILGTCISLASQMAYTIRVNNIRLHYCITVVSLICPYTAWNIHYPTIYGVHTALLIDTGISINADHTSGIE